MSTDTHRSVELSRIDRDHYRATNVRGGELVLGSGEDDAFTPVELLLAAIGGCTGIDVEYLVGKRAEPSAMRIVVSGEKVKDAEQNNRMTDIVVEFHAAFPEGVDGDRARAFLPTAVARSHDRICTVSRTVALPTPVSATIAED